MAGSEDYPDRLKRFFFGVVCVPRIGSYRVVAVFGAAVPIRDGNRQG